MKAPLVYIMLLISGWASAQTVRETERRTVIVQPNQELRVAYDQPYSSVLFQAPMGQTMVATYLIAAGDTIRLQPDPHAPDGQIASVLCVFRHPVTDFLLQTGSLTGEVSLVTVYVPPLPAGYVQAQLRASARQRADCDKPTVVPASVWRIGLTPPKEKPLQTKVQFVIVHHSAGSNTTTDFTEEVRNIYVQHTQINGWNDVGYNFLIGRDGVIYEGRDGQGLMDGDNVLGAHFCAQNSGTMGICLMGNFNDVQPSAVSVASLDQLIGWKLKKEGLQPIGMAFHPGSAKQLNLISGHRDGVCATECPGNNLYAALPTIRQAVSQSCSFTSAVEPTPLATEPGAADWTVYPNPSRGELFVQHAAIDPAQVRFEVTDVFGRTWLVRAVQTAFDRWRIDSGLQVNGLFWLRCTEGTSTTVRQIWRVLN